MSGLRAVTWTERISGWSRWRRTGGSFYCEDWPLNVPLDEHLLVGSNESRVRASPIHLRGLLGPDWCSKRDFSDEYEWEVWDMRKKKQPSKWEVGVYFRILPSLGGDSVIVWWWYQRLRAQGITSFSNNCLRGTSTRLRPTTRASQRWTRWDRAVPMKDALQHHCWIGQHLSVWEDVQWSEWERDVSHESEAERQWSRYQATQLAILAPQDK